MRILIDAMGGDLAPRSNALGAIRAAQELGVEVVLVGRGEAILQCLKENGIDTLPKGVEIANAEDVVDMHDDPRGGRPQAQGLIDGRSACGCSPRAAETHLFRRAPRGRC